MNSHHVWNLNPDGSSALNNSLTENGKESDCSTSEMAESEPLVRMKLKKLSENLKIKCNVNRRAGVAGPSCRQTEYLKEKKQQIRLRPESVTRRIGDVTAGTSRSHSNSAASGEFVNEICCFYHLKYIYLSG